jgi:hypothetical protein
VNARRVAVLLSMVALASLSGACLTERNLDKPPAGLTPPDPPHLAVRRPKKTLVHEWTVLAQQGHDDVLHGKDLTWYPGGAKEWERAFDHGQPKGLWRKWYENGQLESETDFAGPDVERPMRFWYANGKPSAEGLAKNGARCGMWKFWNDDGTLHEQGQYLGSLREGPWIVWDQDGSTSHTVQYVHGDIILDG